MFEFLWKPSCNHDKITPNMVAGYCPDCGDYVENHWYITRCECCGLRQKAFIRNGQVRTEAKFCKNCGSQHFATERIDQLDIVSINYAIVKKQVREAEKQSFVKTWIEQNSYGSMKLIPSY